MAILMRDYFNFTPRMLTCGSVFRPQSQSPEKSWLHGWEPREGFILMQVLSNFLFLNLSSIYTRCQLVVI